MTGMALKGDLGAETTFPKEGKTDDADETEEDLGEKELESKPAWPCQPSKFFIRENGTFMKYWEIIIIFLALYNAILIPLQLFF